jgi:hypothetical protein
MTGAGMHGSAVALAVVAALGVASVVVVRDMLDTDCSVPDVTGLASQEAVDRLESVGIPASAISVERRAGDEPEGTVVDRSATTCRSPVQLIVSDGGPAVAVDDLSSGLQALLADGPGDVPDAVRLVETSAGPAFKSDATMVGDCPAVAAAGGLVEDDDYAVRCRTPPAQILTDTVATMVATWYPGRDDVPGHDVTMGDDGDAWYGRTDLGGWRLFTAVTTNAEPEWVSAGLSRDEVRGGGYAVSRGVGDVQAVVYLVRPRERTVEVPRPPIGGEEIDELVVSLVDLAKTW